MELQIKQAIKLIKQHYNPDFKLVYKCLTKKGNVVISEVFNGVCFQDYVVDFTSKVIYQGWFKNLKFASISKKQF